MRGSFFMGIERDRVTRMLGKADSALAQAFARRLEARWGPDPALAQAQPVAWKTLPLERAVRIVHGNGTRQIALFSDPNCVACQALEQTLEQLDDVTVQINTPLPNTPQFNMAPKYGQLNPDFSRYNFWRPVYVPHGMTEDELIWWHREFYKRFYWRAKTVKAHVKKKLLHFHTFVNYMKTLNLFVYLAFKRESPGFVGHT